MESRNITTDLAIIGSGLAGFAASIFALNKKIHTTQAGNTGALAYTTGYLDLLGKSEQGWENNPWKALKKLQKTEAKHPLSRIDQKDIRKSFQEFTSFIGDIGLQYTDPEKENLQMLSPAGTIKTTLCVPQSMLNGSKALAKKQNCLFVDIRGLRGFSAKEIVANLQDTWPNIRSIQLCLSGFEHGEVYPEVLARSLEVPANLEKFAQQIKEELKGDQVIGLPAILGMHKPDRIAKRLQELLGIPVFEIPTMPPAVPGIRLRELFEQVFPQKGVNFIAQQKVQKIEQEDDELILYLNDNFGEIIVHAKAVILATGRFLSGGLEAKIDKIQEPLLNLFVHQPASRKEWYHDEYISKEGHPIHKSGILVDKDFRPLQKNGDIVSPRLFAAGSILAHQDWIRSRSGAGVAIPTAFKAVEAAQKIIAASK